MSDAAAIGVDIGGTKIAFVLTNQAGDVLATHRLPAQPDDGVEAVLNRIAEGINVLLEQAQGSVKGIGIGCPGHVDPTTGIVRTAVNLGWTEVSLGAEVKRRIAADLPVWVHKDANAAALGEMYYGAAKDCADFVYLAIGTGLGGGAVVNGDLILGTNFFANEVGHLSLDPDGRQCACGQRGCVETYLSGIGFNNGFNEHRADFPDSPLALADQPDTAAILDAARAGDSLATLIVDEAGRWFGAIMACCAAVLNPSLFVIGGGLGHAAADLLFERAEAELKRRVLPPTLDKVSIVLSQVTDSAIGAASLVWHHDE